MNHLPLISVLVCCGLLIIWAPLIIFACCRASSQSNQRTNAWRRWAKANRSFLT